MAEMAKMPQFAKEEIIRIVKRGEEQKIGLCVCSSPIFSANAKRGDYRKPIGKALDNKCMFDGSSIEGFEA